MSRPGAGHDGPDDALVEALRRLLQSRLGRGVRRIDTHVSWVLLDGEHAWKIKKPVRLGFLDFSRIDVRRRCCEEELRLNRRLAPSIYLDVLPVRGSVASPLVAGAPDRDGQRDGEAIEYVLRMKQFAPGSLLSERLAAGRLLPDTIDRLARRLADFQAAAPQAPADSDFGSAALVRATTTGVLDGIASQAQAPRAEGLRDWCESRATDLASCFESRKARGRVREGHGDLHLSNLVVLEDEVTAFDCIEFDPGLRWIDVVCDIAFITMDLRAHGRRDLAFRFLDRWLEAGGDHGGLAVLRYYEVYRALVRALVAGIRRAQDDAPSRATGASGPGHEPDYLGAAQDLHPNDIEADTIASSSIVYLEGYLFDREEAKAAFRQAVEIANGAGRRVALTLSDSFCVNRHRKEFLALIRSGIGILFANESEILALYETTSFDEAMKHVARDTKLAVLTRSEKGSVILSEGTPVMISAEPVSKVVDTTGAGDLYAAGFLYGLARGFDLKAAGQLGSFAAAEIIGQMGARPEVKLSHLARMRGFID